MQPFDLPALADRISKRVERVSYNSINTFYAGFDHRFVQGLPLLSPSLFPFIFHI
jgi:hypothetical protein